MLLCLAAACAWLLGLACQMNESNLGPLWAYQLAVAWVLAWAFLTLWLARGGARHGRSSPRARRLRSPAVVMFAAALLAWGSTGWRATEALSERVPDRLANADVRVALQIEGLVNTVPGGFAFVGRVLSDEMPDRVAARALPTRLSLRMPSQGVQTPLEAGQRWRMTVRVHELDGLSNPAGFDATLGLFQRGIRAAGVVRLPGRGRGRVRAGDGPNTGSPALAVPELISASPEYPWQGCVDRWRQRTRAAIASAVPEARSAGVLSGLAVGDQSAIERPDWDVFRRTGVAHLVSISGAHIAMFGWMAAMLVRRVWARWPAGVHAVPAPTVALWAAVLASAGYAVLAGWGVPAQRTVWMMLVMAMLKGSGRRWPAGMVWAMAAVVITAADPWALRQAGFWLSFVAVGVLMSTGISAEHMALAPGAPALQRAGSLARGVVSETWRTQWVITVALLPLSVVCFQQVSVVSLLSNLLAIPVFTFLLTPLALLGGLWSGFWTAGAVVVELTMVGLTDMAQWPWAVWQAPALPVWAGACAVLAAWALVLPMPWRWRAVAVPFILPLLALPPGWHVLPSPLPGQFEVLSADIGQGTAVLVRTAHHSLLFDTGPRVGEHSNAGDRVLLPLMQAMGVHALDTLLISHQDTDHVGGAEAIVRAMPVGALLSSLPDDHPLRQQVGQGGHTLRHRLCQAGQSWQWDGVGFTVLHPSAADWAQHDRLPPNGLSCVLRVSRVAAPAVSALLTGDIESPQELALLARDAQGAVHGGVLASTLLLAPHHGSKTSSTEAFLKAVAPAQVMVQAGARNRYGHPAPEVMARYESLSLPVATSPACGAHIWSSRTRQGVCWRQSDRHYWQGAFMQP